jgi:hypothetical protein
MKRVRFTEDQIIAVLPVRCQALPAVLEMSERRACSLVAADRKMDPLSLTPAARYRTAGSFTRACQPTAPFGYRRALAL